MLHGGTCLISNTCHAGTLFNMVWKWLWSICSLLLQSLYHIKSVKACILPFPVLFLPPLFCFSACSVFQEVWNIKLWPPVVPFPSSALSVSSLAWTKPICSSTAGGMVFRWSPPSPHAALCPINRDVNKFRQLPDLCLRLMFERHHKDLFWSDWDF